VSMMRVVPKLHTAKWAGKQRDNKERKTAQQEYASDLQQVEYGQDLATSMSRQEYISASQSYNEQHLATSMPCHSCHARRNRQALAGDASAGKVAISISKPTSWNLLPESVSAS